MRKEISVAVIVGLLWGSAMLAPGAATKANSGSPKQASPNKVSPLRASIDLPGEQGLSYYKAIGERNLFKPIMPEIPMPVSPPPTFVVETPPPPPPPPTTGWTYSGYASIDGVDVAILQETESGSAVFLHKGEDFRGGTVDEITLANVRITFDGRPVTLQKSNEYTINQNSQSNAGPTTPGGLMPPTTPNPRGGYNPPAPRQSAYAASMRQRADEMRRAYLENMRTTGRDRMRGRRGLMNMPPPSATGGAAPLPQPMRPQ